jgi:hypothetical protein
MLYVHLNKSYLYVHLKESTIGQLGQVMFFLTSVLSFLFLKRQSSWWTCRAMPLLLLLGRLAELKHVVGLTKLPTKTLPTMPAALAQLHTHTHAPVQLV